MTIMLYNTSSLIFLSTLSLRRATQKNQHQRKRKDISIHALLAESDARRALGFVDPDISIHALLAESDNVINHSAHPHKSFLSTLSLRRATLFENHIFFCHSLFLSTLSLRRATANSRKERQGQHDFYPRSPCGERPPYNLMIHHAKKFLSTLSLRRATKLAEAIKPS